MKTKINPTPIVILGCIAVLALFLEHSKNRRERNFGRKLESDVIKDAEDIFFDDFL